MSYENSKPRLLVVDDEEINIQLLTRLFRENCDIDTAMDGQAALNQLQMKTYDLVLLDIMMPVLNGLEVLRTIRRSQDIATLPVILVSAVTERADVARGIQLGANDYITKPLDIDIVRARVTTQIIMKQLMDERHRHIGQLQQLNDVRTRMVQVASHDLKNPLNNLRMLARIMRDEAANPEKILDLTDMLENSLGTMLGVIEGFLDSQLVGSDDLVLAMQPVDTEEIIQQVIKQYTVAAQQKQINLHVNGISHDRILADSNRLQQVLSNLVSNAIKYSPIGSTVTVSSQTANHRWRLRVIDEGPGIPAEEHHHLFQPFSTHKISTKPTGGESSTGLGLWIVKQMIELQDGTVGVEFPQEGGSVFWLELAIAPQTAEA